MAEQTDWLKELARESCKSGHNWWVVFLLSLWLGFLGVDRFYLNRFWLGLFKLLTFGGYGIWWLADIILLLMGKMKDDDGFYVRRP